MQPRKQTDAREYDLYEERVTEIVAKLKQENELSPEKEGVLLLLMDNLSRRVRDTEIRSEIDELLKASKETSGLLTEIKDQYKETNTKLDKILSWKSGKDDLDTYQSKKIDEHKEDIRTLKEIENDRNKWTWEKFVRVGGFIILLGGVISTINVSVLTNYFLTKDEFTSYTKQVDNDIEDVSKEDKYRFLQLTDSVEKKIEDLRADINRKSLKDEEQTQLIQELIVEFKVLSRTIEQNNNYNHSNQK